jgi:RNA polymerase sigma-70 factor (ECF subfamily)
MGDRKAFDFIYRKFAPQLYRYAQKNIGSHEDAKEIVQDVFMYLWSRHSTFNFENVWGYLLKATRTRIADYFRTCQTKQRYARHYKFFEAVYDPFDYHVEHAIDIDPDEIHEMINRSLPALPEKCQQAFRMRLSQNLSNAEIALRMNVKKATIEHYMVQALNHFRASYKEMIRTTIQLLPLFIPIIPV